MPDLDMLWVRKLWLSDARDVLSGRNIYIAWKNYSETWIRPGIKSVEKDSAKKHANDSPYLEARRLHV